MEDVARNLEEGLSLLERELKSCDPAYDLQALFIIKRALSKSIKPALLPDHSQELIN